MTTSRSPLRQLKTQADQVAAQMKAFQRGEVGSDPTGKLAAARARDEIKIGVVMDDKMITIEIPWATIEATSEAGLAEYVLRHMRGAREAVH